MHQVFISDGIVLGKRALGESNTRIAVLTRELGLVKVHARSTRVEKSKLRYGLEVMTRARFTFVKGRHEWRLTGVSETSRDLIGTTIARRAAAGRIVKLLLRLIRGEEVTPVLYETVQMGLSSLAHLPMKTGVEVDTAAQSIETVLVLRILSHLGYLPSTPELRPFVEQDFFSIEMAEEVQKSRALLMRAINESLTATGL
ncbi:recombination protein O N-terminal domain-containing protein [Acetobacteraceae bacterium]|nr:recombination protein O N-terminal domain-containing protein [Candidatus Parcubacteria bacterium]